MAQNQRNRILDLFKGLYGEVNRAYFINAAGDNSGSKLLERFGDFNTFSNRLGQGIDLDKAESILQGQVAQKKQASTEILGRTPSYIAQKQQIDQYGNLTSDPGVSGVIQSGYLKKDVAGVISRLSGLNLSTLGRTNIGAESLSRQVAPSSLIADRTDDSKNNLLKEVERRVGLLSDRQRRPGIRGQSLLGGGLI